MSTQTKGFTTTTTNHEGFTADNITTTAQVVYVVYETTNNITGQTYAGYFSYVPGTARGEYKNDKYIGQGVTWDGQSKLLKPTAFTDNVTDYGYDSFTRKDLAICSTKEQALEFEATYVDAEYVNNPMTLNQREGGRHGKLGKQSRKRRSVQYTGGGNPNAKRVLYTETGKIYGSIKEAAKKLKTTTYQIYNNPIFQILN